MFRLFRISRKKKPTISGSNKCGLAIDIPHRNNSVLIGDSLHSYFSDVRDELSGKVPKLNSEPVTPMTPLDDIPELSRDSSFEMSFVSAQPRDLSVNTSAKNSMDSSFFETGAPVKRSFDVLIQRPSGLSAFEQQLKKEFSDELMDFFLEANGWRRCFGVIPKTVHEGNAKRICDKFIGNSAESAVNLPDYMIKQLQEGIKSRKFLEQTFFDDAICEAMKLMEQGPYMRFKGNYLA